MSSIAISMQKGIARGIFSNEAGLGSAPIAAAAAKTKEPVRQGLVTMTGTFIDTIIVCTLTGLSIVMMGSYKVVGLEGVQVTTHAFQNGLSFLPAEVSSFILMVCLVFFAFTTILGILIKQEQNSSSGIQMVIHLSSIHWTIYDSKGSMDNCRYL